MFFKYSNYEERPQKPSSSSYNMAFEKTECNTKPEKISISTVLLAFHQDALGGLPEIRNKL